MRLHYIYFFILISYDYFVKGGLTILKRSPMFKMCTQAYYYKIQGI
jgi:hypothetical protein